ncbi:uncharacterized protein LOC135830532, partial [Sycon ciliatum]
MPGDNSFPEMYGLPKDHKSNIPLRPVVAACGSPVTNISIVLERILNQCLQFVPAHLENTVEALQCMRSAFPNLKAPPGTIIVTMDVVALYPSIPINDGIAAVMRVLRQHEGSIDLFGFRIGQVKELLAHVLSSNYFRFGAQVYHQKDGVAMGNNLAPPFAILYMHDLESSLLRSAPASPVLYKRYIDDVFIVWNLGPELLQSFLDHFNNADPNIKFTHQSTELTGSINFMDTTVHVSPDGSISYELYRKPCHSGLVSDYNSSVPNQQKKAIASSEFLRAVRLSSDADTLKRSEEKVTNILKFNNFP